jgi:hypothetical protein
MWRWTFDYNSVLAGLLGVVLIIGHLLIGVAGIVLLLRSISDCKQYRSGYVQDGVDDQGRPVFIKHRWCAEYKPGHTNR